MTAFARYAETFFLSTLRCGRDISCQPPLAYARRFVDFAQRHVIQTAHYNKADAVTYALAFAPAAEIHDGLSALLPRESKRAADRAAKRRGLAALAAKRRATSGAASPASAAADDCGARAMTRADTFDLLREAHDDEDDATAGRGARSCVHADTEWALVCHWPDVCERMREVIHSDVRGSMPEVHCCDEFAATNRRC